MAERKYTQKQIDALSMADTELAAELYPYLENRPMAKLGLDAYLYEYPKGEKQKLLPIETIPEDQLGTNKKSRITGFKSPRSIAQYDYNKDKISMSQKLFTRPVDKYKSYQKYSERQPMAIRKEQIATLVHELEHRGEKLFFDANRDLNFTNLSGDIFHAEIYKRDAETRKKLGLPPPSKYFYDPEKNKYYIRDARRGQGRRELSRVQAYTLRKGLESQVNKFLKKHPAMFYQDMPRYPSITNKKKRTGGIVNKYARGKKVYTNQGPRKARIR